jgi:hypothetical protein
MSLAARLLKILPRVFWPVSSDLEPCVRHHVWKGSETCICAKCFVKTSTIHSPGLCSHTCFVVIDYCRSTRPSPHASTPFPMQTLRKILNKDRSAIVQKCKIFNNNHLQLSRNAGSQGKSLIQILNTFHNLKCSLSFQVVQHERERDHKSELQYMSIHSHLQGDFICFIYSVEFYHI